jgi:hypothetical protein
MQRVGIVACWWLLGVLACSAGEKGAGPTGTLGGSAGEAGSDTGGAAGGSSGEAGSPSSGGVSGEGLGGAASGGVTVSEGGSGGGGSGGTTSVGGAGTGGALPEGCVEVVVSPERVELAPDWDRLIALNGGVWRTESGLHVSWTAYRPVEGRDEAHMWLFVGTFDPTNGELLHLRKYDVLPPVAGVGDSNIEGMSGSD